MIVVQVSNFLPSKSVLGLLHVVQVNKRAVSTILDMKSVRDLHTRKYGYITLQFVGLLSSKCLLLTQYIYFYVSSPNNLFVVTVESFNIIATLAHPKATQTSLCQSPLFGVGKTLGSFVGRGVYCL